MAKHRRVRHYARRLKRRAGKMTIPIAVVGGVVGMPAISGMIQSLSQGKWYDIPIWAKNIAGINSSNQFDWNLLQSNMLPLIAGVAVHKAAGIIGVNRMLAKSKIPFLRV